jgi:hypothetical protein
MILAERQKESEQLKQLMVRVQVLERLSSLAFVNKSSLSEASTSSHQVNDKTGHKDDQSGHHQRRLGTFQGFEREFEKDATMKVIISFRTNSLTC